MGRRRAAIRGRFVRCTTARMLRRKHFALLPLGLLLAACSGGGTSVPSARKDGTGDTATEPTAKSEESTRDRATSESKTNICATLDYGHTRSNDDYYLRFADDAAAAQYSQGFLSANGIAGNAKVSNDAWLTGLVARLFKGFQEVFPRETEGLTDPPRVLVIDESGVNAFAGFDERKEYNKAPWLFWVHRGVFDGTTPKAEVEGLVAHELAHLVLRNMLPETRAKIRRYYRVPGGREHGIFGANTPDDPAVRKHAGELRTLGAMAGRASVFGALPISAFEESEYDSLLQTLAKLNPQAADGDACRTAQDGLRRAKDFYKEAVTVHDLTLILSQDQETQLTTFANSIAAALQRCYGNVRASLFELKVRDRSVSPEAQAQMPKLLDPTTEEHKAAYALLMDNELERNIDTKSETRPAIERLLEVVQTAHARIAELEADPKMPIDELRVFDMEEDADDAAVRVIRAAGDDVGGISRLFLGQIGDGGACRRLLDDGKVPRYGRFVDVHNATCWRAFHVREFAKAIDHCPKSVTHSSSSSSSNSSDDSRMTSPADRSPMRMVKERLRRGM